MSLLVSTTGIDGQSLADLVARIELLGHQYVESMPSTTSVLIAGSNQTTKFKVAQKWQIAIVSPSWVRDGCSYARVAEFPVHPMAGIKVSSSSLTTPERSKLNAACGIASVRYEPSLHRSCTYLVVPDQRCVQTHDKMTFARRHNITVVGFTSFLEVLQSGAPVVHRRVCGAKTVVMIIPASASRELIMCCWQIGAQRVPLWTPAVTHVILAAGWENCGNSLNEVLRKDRSVRVVSDRWLRACSEQKEIVDDLPYRMTVEQTNDNESLETTAVGTEDVSLDQLIKDIEDSLSRRSSAGASPEPPVESMAPSQIVSYAAPVLERVAVSPPGGGRVFLFARAVREVMPGCVDVVQSFGGRVTDRVDVATHYVVHRLTKTETLLASVAGGKWVLLPDYIKACQRAGNFVAEEPFEWGLLNVSPQDRSGLLRTLISSCTLQRQSYRRPFEAWKVVLCCSDAMRAISFSRILREGKCQSIRTMVHDELRNPGAVEALRVVLGTSTSHILCDDGVLLDRQAMRVVLECADAVGLKALRMEFMVHALCHPEPNSSTPFEVPATKRQRSTDDIAVVAI